MASPTPTVFFSPGMFHTPWIFDTVRSKLSDRGFATGASNLVSASTAIEAASEGMLSDAKHLRSLLLNLIELGKEVVFVAHSYGGVVVSNAVQGLSVQQRAAEGKQGGIVMIIYLCALVIPAGQNVLSIADPASLPWDETGDGFIVSNNPLHHFYADVEPSLAAKAVDALKPMSSKILTDVATYEPWNQGFNVGYIFTDNDNVLSTDAQKTMFAQFPDGSFTATLACGHSPFFNIPDALVDTIQDGINYALKKGVST
ncbi:hypothetical protein F5Y12DRAFT_711976 [Xylaria sp. FL1777]|nr:hypothetical protein F5Y12DRAFT_711976 [Xylaria sp. FL1777]